MLTTIQIVKGKKYNNLSWDLSLIHIPPHILKIIITSPKVYSFITYSPSMMTSVVQTQLILILSLLCYLSPSTHARTDTKNKNPKSIFQSNPKSNTSNLSPNQQPKIKPKINPQINFQINNPNKPAINNPQVNLQIKIKN